MKSSSRWRRSSRGVVVANDEEFVQLGGDRAGPYRYWHHEHRFEALPDGTTRCVDIVHYVPRFGFAGRIAHRLFVRRDLHKIFSFRRRAMHHRFGDPEAPAVQPQATRSVA